MTHTSGPLAGVRVLDMTQLMAGPYCTALLADLGADVIKIEKPETGDDARRMGTSEDQDASPPFIAMNRNKRGIVLDIKSELGASALRELVRGADVLVENFRPGTMDRLGLGYEALAEIRPELVYCSISGFGATGPYRDRGGFDLVAQAMSGLLSMTGSPEAGPAKVGVPICDLNAGMYAAIGVLSAYIHRLKTGVGQFLDTSLLDSGIAYTVWETAALFSSGDVASPLGTAHRLSAPYQLLPTGDGWIAIGAANDRTFGKLCAAIELDELVNDSRFVTNAARMRNRDELIEVLSNRLRERTTADWLEPLHRHGVPSGPMYDVEQVYQDPHVQARDMLVTTEHPRMGTVRHIGSPVKLSKTPMAIQRTAPLLGEHTREVLIEAGIDEATVERTLGVDAVAVAVAG
ncbi:CaiB/BaiF CoA transferase family protein [Rhodococcoides kyotonense]|uniref:Formyl-CoA transferase n=1 Tax=Rhodococcoides kyotonense TaxID=398843 RepID=A0A239NEM9_9NOCA|nr:CoA transferase [Rhodococcus kyotonensis]SNT53325.1 formyl-CoA transferase [Rhodococcus kyotonensis]